MMINHNISALNAQRHVFDTNLNIDRSLERLTTGLKINSAADDASGLAISKKMEAQNLGLDMANQNAQDGQALYKIAEGGLNQVNDMLSRMEELTTRAINATLTDGDRKNIQDEIDQLLDQINVISKTTEYNTISLLDGTLNPDVTSKITKGNQNSIRVVDVPGSVKTGKYDFAITTVPAPAVLANSGTAASAATTHEGVININGTTIKIDNGDSMAMISSKINAVSDQTGVLASFYEDSAVPTRNITLVTGVQDEDVKNINWQTANSNDMLGYAKVGSDQKIKLSGNTDVLLDMGFNMSGVSVLTATGVDAGGTLNSVPMVGHGSRLKATAEGQDGKGLEIDIDAFRGGNGVYILNNQANQVNIVDQNHPSKVSDTATFNIDTSNRLRLQIGANYNQQLYDGVPDISTDLLGVGASSKIGSLKDIDVTTGVNANLSLKVIQKSIVDVTSSRSKIGALINRLEYTVKTLQIQKENMTAAQSRIEDADMAKEMTAFTKEQIKLQSGTAMMAQANSRPQTVLQLLKG